MGTVEAAPGNVMASCAEAQSCIWTSLSVFESVAAVVLVSTAPDACDASKPGEAVDPWEAMVGFVLSFRNKRLEDVMRPLSGTRFCYSLAPFRPVSGTPSLGTSGGVERASPGSFSAKINRTAESQGPEAVGCIESICAGKAVGRKSARLVELTGVAGPRGE
jgi:hypothetical protein